MWFTLRTLRPPPRSPGFIPCNGCRQRSHLAVRFQPAALSSERTVIYSCCCCRAIWTITTPEHSAVDSPLSLSFLYFLFYTLLPTLSVQALGLLYVSTFVGLHHWPFLPHTTSPLLLFILIPSVFLSHRYMHSNSLSISCSCRCMINNISLLLLALISCKITIRWIHTRPFRRKM